MKTKVNNALFELIKSLSKSEKRYFKIISSRHTIGDENNYVRLFDYLDSASSYDEERLFKDFQGEAFLHRFSITKKRLYDNILKALNSYHSDRSFNAQLYNMLQSADVLFDKSLYDQCRRVLMSAEKLALKCQNDHIIQIIHGFQRRLIETNGYASADWNDIQELIDKVDHAGQRIAFINQLWKVKGQLFRQLITKGIARTSKEKEVYDQICLVLEGEMNLYVLNFESIYLINHIRSVHFFATGEIDRSYLYLKKNIEHCELNPDPALTDPAKMISALTNTIYIADKLGKHNEALLLLSQLRSILAKQELTEDLNIKTFATYSSISLSLLIRMGDFKSAAAEAKKVVSGLEEFGTKLNTTRKAHLLFNVAVVNFGNGNFQDSLKMIHSILNDQEMDANENLIGYTYLLELANYVELNKTDLLRYKLKSVERFAKSRNRMHDCENAFIRFIAEWIKSEDPLTQKEILSKYLEKMKDIEMKNPLETLESDHFDIAAWLESRLADKTFGEVIRERYNKHMRTAS